ncbi:MAG: hemerythrin [Spirochaetes bacterium RBG_13_51_14]|nr:MAG: hemerythrin [Spirochaetes bacterium RBG_13_51_14]
MSEFIDNSGKKRTVLKELILKLHRGESPEQVKAELRQVLGQIPYGDVVQVEQELIAEGLPQEEVVKLCDVHTAVLDGSIDRGGAKAAPPGHPVHTFTEENRALEREIAGLEALFRQISDGVSDKQGADLYYAVINLFNRLMDVDKHYQRKENLVFPYLEKHGITGPPAVMWAKHDEARAALKKALQSLRTGLKNESEIRRVLPELQEATRSVTEMIGKEDNILFPMCLDALTEDEWYDIYRQSPGIGFCLYDPKDPWKPAHVGEDEASAESAGGRIVLPTGSISVKELISLLNAVPCDITFVDADDRVRYFSQGRDRIFTRSRAIIGRMVQQCHPPASVAAVQSVLDDFRSGRHDSAAFWINHKGKFIHIEYFALRDDKGGYLGTMEVSQDLTEKKKLEGERRLVKYA